MRCKETNVTAASITARLHCKRPHHCGDDIATYRVPNQAAMVGSHEELEEKYENTVSTSASEVIEQIVEYSPGNSRESVNTIFPPNNRRRVKILKKVPRLKNRFTSKHG